MISQSAKDWTDNPVITSTDNVEAPMRNLPFPSLTVCHKDPKFHLKWKLPEHVFNFIDMQKKSDPKIQKLLDGFSNYTYFIAMNYIRSVFMISIYCSN